MYGIEPVAFVDRLTKHDLPRALPAFEKVVEAAGAHRIAEYPMNESALRDRRFCLSDRPFTDNVDVTTTQVVLNPDPAGGALPRKPDELCC